MTSVDGEWVSGAIERCQGHTYHPCANSGITQADSVTWRGGEGEGGRRCDAIEEEESPFWGGNRWSQAKRGGEEGGGGVAAEGPNGAS